MTAVISERVTNYASQSLVIIKHILFVFTGESSRSMPEIYKLYWNTAYLLLLSHDYNYVRGKGPLKFNGESFISYKHPPPMSFPCIPFVPLSPSLLLTESIGLTEKHLRIVSTIRSPKKDALSIVDVYKCLLYAVISVVVVVKCICYG
jgi:hypothetical protein